MNDTICGGTGGSGWDNEDGGEVKNSSHVQSKFAPVVRKYHSLQTFAHIVVYSLQSD